MLGSERPTVSALRERVVHAHEEYIDNKGNQDVIQSNSNY